MSAEKNLMEFLREDLGLTGTKNGCNSGHCGACTIILDGKARRACLVKMRMIDGAEIQTIEGFVETNAAQCGFCTPGVVMTAKALLDLNPAPTRSEITKALTVNNNICRCTGYVSIIDGVELAAKRMGVAGLREFCRRPRFYIRIHNCEREQ